jgi:proteasome lid subunit RPN8/RPN11
MYRTNGMVNSIPEVGIVSAPWLVRVDDVMLIPMDIRDQMVDHANEELPNEACGLLAGPDGEVAHYFAMRNADRSPVTYRLDPKEQIQVFNEIDEKGWDLVGIFHSHTHTEAYPSPTDRAQAYYPDATYLLLSLATPDEPELRGFSIRDGQVREMEVQVR